jgi:hypothetical protein
MHSEGWFASETSHAGIIRIGFEGISQPRLSEHPCFNNLIETLSAPNLQIRGLATVLVTSRDLCTESLIY